MNQDSSHAEGSEDSKSFFEVTQWSLILSVAQDDTAQSELAREEFCRTYWHAVYGFIRARGKSVEEAQDLTQEFFLSHLLVKNAFKTLDPQKGKFRGFLRTALGNFLANDYDKRIAQKRSPGKPLVSLAEAEEKYLACPNDGMTDEMVYDRQWAKAISDRASTRLRERYLARGKGDLFETLKVYLSRSVTIGDYEDLAARFQMQPSAVKQEVYRLRFDCKELYQAQLRQAVESEQDFNEEWQYFIKVLSG